MKLVASALAVAAFGLPAAHASPAGLPGLVYKAGYGNSILTRFDPVTLERSGPRVRLGGNASSWAYSPGRRYLAIAGFPQRLTVVEAGTMRVVSRIRLAPGGGVTHAVTWTRDDRVLAVVDTPGGAVVATVDPLAGRVVRRLRIPRPFGFQFERLPDGLVFLLSTRGSIAPVQVAIVDAQGRPVVVEVFQATIGNGRLRSGGFEQQLPGLAVDPAGRRAYVVSGPRTFVVDLRTLEVSDPGPLRMLAKSVGGSIRSAHWLGGWVMAVSGADYAASRRTPYGLRLVDVRNWTSRTIDPTADGFTVAGRLLLVEEPVGRRALLATAYGFDGRGRYQTELAGATWMKKQGVRGYTCRDAFLRSVVDLATGTVLRSGFAPSTRCPTLLAGDSRA